MKIELFVVLTLITIFLIIYKRRNMRKEWERERAETDEVQGARRRA
jgi:hypothetical protein